MALRPRHESVHDFPEPLGFGLGEGPQSLIPIEPVCLILGISAVTNLSVVALDPQPLRSYCTRAAGGLYRKKLGKV